MKNLSQELDQNNEHINFLVGDFVVYESELMQGDLFEIIYVSADRIMMRDADNRYSDGINIRHASVAELRAKRRLCFAEQAIAEVP